MGQTQAMVIEYYVKNVYGTDKLYIRDPVQAMHFSNLTNTKTVSPVHIHALKQLAGIEFKQILQKIEMPM